MSRLVMNSIATAVLLAAMTVAFAQEPAERSSVRRAPLADVESLEPAVDVSEPRVALIRRAEAQTATPPASPAPAAAAEAAPPVPPPAPPSSGSPTPQNRPAASAMDSLDLGTTSITGNAELPKVLYIVPWKKSDLGDLVGRPVNTLLDEVLAPVDPEVFERHLDYYETLHGASQEE
jgi:hypothetical protein